MKDVASAQRTLPQWENYQKGLETLAASLAAVNSHGTHLKKSLTAGDLLVKVGLKKFLVARDSDILQANPTHL